MTSTSKLEELRARTDRELAEYINRRLELGFHLARTQSWASAQAAYAEAARLLPVIYDRNEMERRRLQSQLARLRDVLRTSCLKAS